MKKCLAIFSFFLVSLLAFAQGDVKGYVVPEGTPRWYAMNAYVQTSNGTVMYNGLANQISLSADGKSIYFKTLFPANYEELWVRGEIVDNKIVIDSKATIATLDFFSEYGEKSTYDLKVGEPIFDDFTDNIIGVKDITFVKDGDHIYIEDNQKEPEHAISLYGIDEYGVQLFDWTFCDDFTPYNGPTELITPPATATVQSYVYEYKDSHLTPATSIGHIAVDGNDYYFDNLVPSVMGWVKGVRQGDEVTIARGQLLSMSPMFLRLGGFVQADGGRLSDVVLRVGADGQIYQPGKEQFIVAYQTNGSLFDYGREFHLTPYEADRAFVPSAPTEVHSVYYSELGQHGIEFNQTCTADDGSLLSADQLGYYIYVDGKRFTFNRSQYPYIKDAEMTFIPFGYCDDYNLGDIFNDGIYNCVLFYIQDYTTLGVQSVYRSGDVETRSDIITVDKYNIVEIVPDGIHSADAVVTASPSWYDLSGRRASDTERGLRVSAQRKQINK